MRAVLWSSDGASELFPSFNDSTNPSVNGFNRAKMRLDLYGYGALSLKNVDGEIQSVSSWTMHCG